MVLGYLINVHLFLGQTAEELFYNLQANGCSLVLWRSDFYNVPRRRLLGWFGSNAKWEWAWSLSVLPVLYHNFNILNKPKVKYWEKTLQWNHRAHRCAGLQPLSSPWHAKSQCKMITEGRISHVRIKSKEGRPARQVYIPQQLKENEACSIAMEQSMLRCYGILGISTAAKEYWKVQNWETAIFCSYRPTFVITPPSQHLFVAATAWRILLMLHSLLVVIRN